MAHGRQQFELVGYSEDLERRSLYFVDPIPASRICSACGNIPRLTYTLMCGHTFCDPCYGSCATSSECLCPLDGDVCGRDDVTRKEYKGEQLLRRKVHCWNEANGCRTILPASQVAQHVRRDCQYHVTHCPTCSVVLLSRDVCAHLKSRCTALVLHTDPEALQGRNDKEMTDLVAFERKVEQRVGEIAAKLAHLSLESGSQNDKLVELCHNNNHLKEALAEQFEALTRQFERASAQTVDRLDRNNAEMRALVAREEVIERRVGALDAKFTRLSVETRSANAEPVEVCDQIDHLKKVLTKQFEKTSDRNLTEIKALYAAESESLRTALTSILASGASDQKTHQWVVKGYAALKEKALKDGFCSITSEEVYLRHYLLSWGIRFKKESDSVYLYLFVQFHVGREDDSLDWPFSKELKISIIHPVTREERALQERANAFGVGRKFYSRPIGISNEPVYFSKTKFDASDIEGDGYVEGDQLLVRLEVAI